MKNTFLFAVVLCSFFAACTPAQRLSRLQRKHPELFTKVPLHLHDAGSVQLKPTDSTALNQIDSLLDALIDCGSILDSSIIKQPSNKNIHNINQLANNLDKDKIKQKIKTMYVDKPCIAPGDTLKYIADSTVFRIWQVGNTLKYDHYSLVTVDKAIIQEPKTETPQWKNYLLIAGWILVAVLFLLLWIRR